MKMIFSCEDLLSSEKWVLENCSSRYTCISEITWVRNSLWECLKALPYLHLEDLLNQVDPSIFIIQRADSANCRNHWLDNSCRCVKLLNNAPLQKLAFPRRISSSTCWTRKWPIHTLTDYIGCSHENFSSTPHWEIHWTCPSSWWHHAYRLSLFDSIYSTGNLSIDFVVKDLHDFITLGRLHGQIGDRFYHWNLNFQFHRCTSFLESKRLANHSQRHPVKSSLY